MESNWRETKPSSFNNKIIIHQSSYSRALLVGYIDQTSQKFIPGRLLFGALREFATYEATKKTLAIEPVKTILKNYSEQTISTITVLRETLACNIGKALWESGINSHFGDAFIGATHIKGEGEIKTAYLYENTEGLNPNGLWILADSICMGRNLSETLSQLLSRFQPKEILLLAPLASRRGIEAISAVTNKHRIKITFVAWGGLIGVDEATLYDMPWGHKDTEPFDPRDQDLFIQIYGTKLCVGGDFGNNYYSPSLAKKLYDEQLHTLKINPKFPNMEEVFKTYDKNEFLVI